MFQRTVLPNGLRILTSSMPHTRSVSVNVYIATGSRYESDEDAGISHFLEHLFFKGSERRPTAKEISEAIEGVGGILNAATDRELTVYWVKVARPHFALAVDILVDMLRHPLFAPEEIEKERKVVLEELAMVNDAPERRVETLIDEVCWPHQPLGREVAGTRESVLALTRDQILAYVARQYVPNNTVISIAGDIVHEEVVEMLSAALDDWGRGTPSTWYPAVEADGQPRLGLEYWRSEQAHLNLALPGVGSLDPDRYAFGLLNVVLGEGMSSRLFLEIREKHALAYDVQSRLSQYLDTGSMVVYAGVSPAQAVPALQAIEAEVRRLLDPIPEEEVTKARELSKGRLLLRMEDTRAVAAWLGGQELLSDRILTPDEVVAIIDGLTATDLQQVAQRLLPGQARLAVVGPFRSERRFREIIL